jgi:hypothetical protein
MARRSGWLDHYDLHIEEIPVPSSPEQFRSLLGGDLDAVLTNPDNVLSYRFCPDNPLGTIADVKIVSAVDRGLGLGLYVRTVPSDPDLRSAIWAVDVPTSGFAFVMYALAESFGLGRDDYRLLSLGATPKRLEALLAGTCDVTMLNAGNELWAEASGCRLLGRVTDVCSPYLGTVLAVAGDRHVDAARRLRRALARTTEQILSAALDEEVQEEATAALGLSATLAQRYVARLKDSREGLVRDGTVEDAALAAVIDLRRRYRSTIVDGVDVLAAVRADPSGLVVR